MTSKYRVILLPGAEQDIESTYQWIAARSPAGATRWHRALDASIADLRCNADRYPVAPENHRFEQTIRNATFRMPSGSVYRLLFTIQGDEVQVLFLHGPGRDWASP